MKRDTYQSMRAWRDSDADAPLARLSDDIDARRTAEYETPEFKAMPTAMQEALKRLDRRLAFMRAPAPVATPPPPRAPWWAVVILIAVIASGLLFAVLILTHF